MLDLPMVVHSVTIGLVRVVLFLLLYANKKGSTQREEAVGSRVHADILESLWLWVHADCCNIKLFNNIILSKDILLIEQVYYQDS